jgi:hypothetical protein
MVAQGTSLDRVKAFVAAQTGCPADHLTPRTRLGTDLGVWGMDGDEFIVAFADAFGLDPDSVLGVDWGEHFGVDGVSLGGFLGMATLMLGLFSLGLPHRVVLAVGLLVALVMAAWPVLWSRPRVEVTVGDLVRAAEAGAWVPRRSRG